MTSEKISLKISEVEKQIGEENESLEKLLSDSLLEVDVQTLSNTVMQKRQQIESLNEIKTRLHADLEKSNEAEAIAAEDSVIENFTKVTGARGKEIEKNLSEISKLATSLEKSLENFQVLENAVSAEFKNVGKTLERAPLSNCFELPSGFSEDIFKGLYSTVGRNFARLESAVSETPEKLRRILGEKRQPTVKCEAHHGQAQADCEVFHVTPREGGGWSVPPEHPRLGGEADPSTYCREIQR